MTNLNSLNLINSSLYAIKMIASLVFVFKCINTEFKLFPKIFVYFTTKIKKVQTHILRQVFKNCRLKKSRLWALQIKASLVFIFKSINTKFELFPMIIVIFTAKIKRYNQSIETNFKQLKLAKWFIICYKNGSFSSFCLKMYKYWVWVVFKDVCLLHNENKNGTNSYFKTSFKQL